MSLNSHGVQVVIQIVLGLVIVALAYWLYVSVTEPYEVIRRQQEVTMKTRARMGKVRAVMIRYEELNNRYVTTLDSLTEFVKSDPLYRAAGDSLFGPGFVPDSLVYSPRTGKKFILTVNDTSRVKTYLLKDPDSEDHIGSLEPDITRLNAASWE